MRHIGFTAIIAVALIVQVLLPFPVYVSADSTITRSITAQWPVWGHDVRHTFRGEDGAKGILTPSEKWSVSGGESQGAPIADFSSSITGQLSPRLYIVYSSGPYIRLLDGKTGEVAWELNADTLNETPGEVIYGSPAVLDLNGNTQPDIVFATSSGWVHAFEPRSTYSGGYTWPSDVNVTQMIWSRHLPVSIAESSVAFADVGNTSTPDIIVAGVADTGVRVYALDGDTGDEIWHYDAVGERISSPAIYPYTETKSRIVFNTLESTGSLTSWNMHTYMLRSDGVKAWDVLSTVSTSTLQRVNLLPSPSIAEMDGDTTDGMEIVVPVPFVNGRGVIRVLHRDGGTEMWSTSSGDVVGQFDASAALDDVNGDGIIDVIAVSWSLSGLNPITHAYAFDGSSGSRLWERTIDTSAAVLTSEYALSSPALTDLNKDGTADVVVVTSPSIYAIDGTDGTVLWNMTMTSTFSFTGSPSVADTDQDGFTDVFVSGICISHNIVDLSISSNDISVVPEEPVEQEQSTLAATIHNKGQGKGSNIKVRFLDGNKIIGDKTLDSIGGYDSAEVSISWTPSSAGTHTITVIVDPDNDIDEPNENDNEAANTVTVRAKYVNLMPVSIKFYRSDGVEADGSEIHPIAGKNTRIDITINNTGNKDSDATSMKVLDNGNPVGGLVSVPAIAGGGSAVVSVQWVGSEGQHTISVDVDPGNSVNESNEDDNTMSRSIYVKSADPGDASYIIQGLIFLPDGSTLAAGIPVTIRDRRTAGSMEVVSGDNGDYYADIKDLPGGYAEEDTVDIVIDTNDYKASAAIVVYSEDGGTVKNIVLESKENHSFTMSVAPESAEVKPGEGTYFTITVSGTGNVNTTVTLTVSGIPSSWNWTLTPAGGEITVAPGSNTEAQLYVEPSEDTAAGVTVYPVIKGESVSMSVTTTIAVTVKAVPQLSVVIESSGGDIDLYGSENHTSREVTVSNTGNVDDYVSLTVDSPEGTTARLYYSNGTEARKVYVSMGGSVVLTLEIWATPAAGGAGKSSITVGVTAQSLREESVNVTTHVTIGLKYPDLSIQQGSMTMVPQTPSVGSMATVSFTVANNGPGTAPSSQVTLLRMYPMGGEYVELVLGTADIDTLSSGATATVSITWVVNQGGSYIIRAYADYSEKVTESNENNNYQEMEFSIFPDITVSSRPTVTTARAHSGYTITVRAEISNEGNADASEDITITAYYSYAGSDNMVKLGSTTINGLPAGGSEEIVIEKTIDLDAGTYTLTLVADSSNSTEESDEGNNQAQATFTIPKKSAGSAEAEDNTGSILTVIVLLALVAAVAYMAYMSRKRNQFLREKARHAERSRDAGVVEEEPVEDEEDEEIYVAEVIEEPEAKPSKTKKKKKIKKK